MKLGGWFVWLLIFMLVNCSTPQKTSQGEGSVAVESTCNTLATVKDYTGLDACRFLLELKDGSRLIPITLSDKEFLFSEGQTVKINYKIAKDIVTACLTAATPVEILCIQQIKPGDNAGQEFMKRECKETDVPLTVSWMNKLIIRNKVTEVKRAYHGDQPYYAFYGNVYLSVYNCVGNLVCESLLNDKKAACPAKLAAMEDLKSIWAQK